MRVFIAVAILLLEGGCSLASPKGILGTRWGEDPGQAARRLGITCEGRWAAWAGDPSFEACEDLDHPVVAWGDPAYVRMVRQANALEGVALRFEKYGKRVPELNAKVRRELHVGGKPEEQLYYVWGDGSLVHLECDRSDETCTVTVAGPRFGEAFQAWLLRRGFQDLVRGLTPH